MAHSSEMDIETLWYKGWFRNTLHPHARPSVHNRQHQYWTVVSMVVTLTLDWHNKSHEFREHTCRCLPSHGSPCRDQTVDSHGGSWGDHDDHLCGYCI